MVCSFCGFVKDKFVWVLEVMLWGNFFYVKILSDNRCMLGYRIYVIYICLKKVSLLLFFNSNDDCNK